MVLYLINVQGLSTHPLAFNIETLNFVSLSQSSMKRNSVWDK